MQLPNDPVMLMSVINLKLRDFYSNLDALCEDMNVEKYVYNLNCNRYKITFVTN